jgi:peptidylprolyl isomerase
MSRLGAIAVTLVAAVLLAGCGKSSSPTSSSSGSTTSTIPSSTSSSVNEENKSVTVPDIANATNLQVAPAVSAGSQPAPTTLQMKDLVVGTGAEAKSTNTVRIQYLGANYADGKEFDSSWKGGQPAVFPLSGVIKGFSQGIVGMKVGGRRVVVIPPDLGYGAGGSPPAVGPNETLVFVIDLLGIE